MCRSAHIFDVLGLDWVRAQGSPSIYRRSSSDVGTVRRFVCASTLVHHHHSHSPYGHALAWVLQAIANGENEYGFDGLRNKSPSSWHIYLIAREDNLKYCT